MDLDKFEADFRISLVGKTDAIFSMRLIDLLEFTNMKQLLDIYTPILNAKGNEAAAAYFVSWLSSMPLALQSSISLHNTALNLSLDNVTVQLFAEGDYYQFSFKIARFETEAAPAAMSERPVWRNLKLAAYYSETLLPLFEVLEKASKLDLGQIWGLLPTLFNYYLPVWVEKTADNKLKDKLSEDYHALAQELEPAIFGRKKNPFNVEVRWIEDIRDPGKQVRMKNVCCRYYQIGEGEYCYSCPRLKEVERAVKREEYREKQNA